MQKQGFRWLLYVNFLEWPVISVLINHKKVLNKSKNKVIEFFFSW